MDRLFERLIILFMWVWICFGLSIIMSRTLNILDIVQTQCIIKESADDNR